MYGGSDRESPMLQIISFNKLLEQYDVMAKSKDPFLAAKAQHILKAQEPYPELRKGFDDPGLLEKHKDVIRILMQDVFPELLTNNEIKAASLPFGNLVFNASQRFRNILKNAGEGFELTISNLPEGVDYIAASVVILNFHYNYQLDFKRPFFYDIPDSNGVMRHYRILYNADFLEIFPTKKAKKLTREDVDELLDNFENIELLKEKIPPESFVTKGFVISNMFDVTAEHSISEIKSSLISSNKRGSESFVTGLQQTFKSLFNLPDIQVGFVTYNSSENQFERVFGEGMESFLLHDKDVELCREAFCEAPYQKLMAKKTYVAISNVKKAYTKSKGHQLYKRLLDQGIKSCIFAPIAQEQTLLGVLELVSGKENALNTVNAQKLVDVMPYIVSAVLRSKIEEENLIDAVIQNECTSVHASVYWRFEEEAKKFIRKELEGNQPSFQEIVFKEVFPLYGQIDIKDSSRARNMAVQRDLLIQLSEIRQVLELAMAKNKMPIYEELIFRVDRNIDDIKEVLHTNSEQAVFNFVVDEINPVILHLKKLGHKDLINMIAAYESKIDMGTESYYDHRKNYDESVMMINKKLAKTIDKKQSEAQGMFPHYFERYKTDGVEHNLYIGESIVGDGSYDPIYLNNLRLWQLQVMCDMENIHYKLKPDLPVPLDVTSLILVYNTSLAIRFRMDEKRFDVDGTYNARYEIIKKRIDKSYIKGSRERLTQTGKLAIVYSQKEDELEYLKYIAFLKSKGYFTNNIEIVDLDGLQGVSGLKAIRAEILYAKEREPEKTFTYDDLMEELKA